MKKNFLIYIEDPRFGGPHQYTLNVLDFIKYKFNLKILFSNFENKIFLKEVKNKKIKFDTLPVNFLSFNFFSILKYILFFFYDIYIIRSYLKKNNINVIYSISGFYSLKIILASLFLKIKVIVHFHDTFCNFIFLRLGFFTKFFIDLFIFSSARSYSFYKNFIGEKKYFITQSSIKIFKKKKRFRGKLKKDFNIISVSNINPVKRIEDFLELAKKLRYKNIKFHVIGKVWKSQIYYNNKIKQKMKMYGLSNIFFYNHLNKKGIKKILSNSDLYLCLSKYESSPMSIWEAMSYSLPILSTDVGDLEYFNRKFNFGFIVKENKIKILEKQILKIYYNKKLRNKLGQNSKRFVLNKIDLKKTMGNFQNKIFIYA